MGLGLYLSLGDSMSIDAYPGVDHPERQGRSGFEPGLGAASLLYRNREDVWPEFAGRDLRSMHPGIEWHDHARDGATLADVIGQLSAVRAARGADTLVTLTAGGNDLLAAIGSGRRDAGQAVTTTLLRLEQVLQRLGQRLPGALVLVGTVYDPTDGTGALGGLQISAEELGLLGRFNDGVRALCGRGPARLVDLHQHFLGHGALAPPGERWYWSRSPIEPGATGASELRRLWLRALEGAADHP